MRQPLVVSQVVVLPFLHGLSDDVVHFVGALLGAEGATLVRATFWMPLISAVLPACRGCSCTEFTFLPYVRLFYARVLIGGVLGLQPVDLRFGLLRRWPHRVRAAGTKACSPLRYRLEISSSFDVTSLPSAVMSLITMVELDSGDAPRGLLQEQTMLTGDSSVARIVRSTIPETTMPTRRYVRRRKKTVLELRGNHRRSCASILRTE